MHYLIHLKIIRCIKSANELFADLTMPIILKKVSEPKRVISLNRRLGTTLINSKLIQVKRNQSDLKL
jgi:hypothetical protein